MRILFCLLISLPLWMSGGEFKEKRLAAFRNPEARMSSGDPVVRRTAFRLMLEKENGRANAAKYLRDSDPLIRRAALYKLSEQPNPEALKYLKSALDDPAADIRLLALNFLKSYPVDPEISAKLARLAQEDPVQSVRQLAGILDWPFTRENKLLRDDPSWDHEVVSVKSFKIPEDKWLLATDPARDGHRKGFFHDDFDDRKWKPVKVGAWENQGFPDYDGIGWYRIRFTMPEKIDANAVELYFEGVDESAWVWLNGNYIGKHDVGVHGWEIPFRLDVTGEIKWNRENILTVRVLDTAKQGGIWKPVSIDILK